MVLQSDNLYLYEKNSSNTDSTYSVSTVMVKELSTTN